ncbi:TPA: hypothetical protein DCE37_22495 [Candidatus Latescibacteria bacterium]|nr:hypothetical protein [Candidatus Latescibacterota bacterium]
MPEPLTLPESFNPDTNLLCKTTENGTFHESRQGAGFARRLLANGHAEDIVLAHKVLEATLACQETREDDPHHGNFFWMAEDEVVGDLNAVEFCLENLIPMMMDSADLLEAGMRDRVTQAIRLGLAEIARINVRVSYSNITMLDILNTCLGGELLDDSAIAQRGYGKLNAWIAYTDRSGTPREYNSPTYTRVCVNALGILGRYLKDEESRVRARTFAARIGLTVGHHIHPSTGRWAGPHSRAYHPTIVCESPPEIESVRRWIEDGALPDWVDRMIDSNHLPYEIQETASIDELGVLTTYLSDAFSLGVASIGYGGQSNTLLSHFVRKDAEKPGVFFSRYLTNDKWLGDFYHATDRTKSRNLIDEGQFLGVQNGNRAIALYAQQNLGVVNSAKSSYVWTERDRIDSIHIGEREVTDLPATVEQGEMITVASGDALFAIIPLTRDDIGRDAPIQLVERAGDLVLDIYNYKGSEKSFWEMRPEGPFFQGQPRNGVYIELAERNDYGNVEDFTRTVSASTVKDSCDEPFVSDGTSERIWSLEVDRDGSRVGIEVDLMKWALRRRWTESGDLTFPMLESPFTVQESDGSVSVGRASVKASQGPIWIVELERTNEWIVGYHGPRASAVALTVPGGRIEIPSMTAGTIYWKDGEVTVDAAGMTEAPSIVGGRLVGQN